MPFHLRKCIWKCRLENGGHFVSASMCFNKVCSVGQKGRYNGTLWTIIEQRINTEMFLDYNINVFMPTIKWYRSATLKLSSHEPIKVYHFLKIRINVWISKKYLHNPTQPRHTLSRHNNHVNAVIYRFEQSKSKSIYGEQNVVRCWTIYADIFSHLPGSSYPNRPSVRWSPLWCIISTTAEEMWYGLTKRIQS